MTLFDMWSIMKNPKYLQTDRLKLIAATAEHVRTELEDPDRLTHLLDANVSPAWPPGEYDRPAMEFFLSCFEAGGEAVEGWYGWYAVCANGPNFLRSNSSRSLVGVGGYFGPPDAAGTVEVGYSVLPEWQGYGYASEMVQALVAHAFTFLAVKQVRAHTHNNNPASIKVLLNSGFQAAGAGAEAGTLLYVHQKG
jgi:[ribosomal protein S5]-alanine N-acetyltransferase